MSFLSSIYWSMALLVVPGIWFASNAAVAQESFALEVPGQPDLASRAARTRDHLTITDAEGRTFEYARQPELDTPDGAYQAYFSAAARQYLRWPATGAGTMFIGVPRNASVAWRQSQMQVRRLERGPLVAPREAAAIPVGPMHLAMLPDRDGGYVVAHFDDSGQLQFYSGRDGQWRHVESRLRENLVPGAPLALAGTGGDELPRVYTVSLRGELVEIIGGRQIRNLSGRGDPAFRSGTPLTIVSRGGRPFAFASDDRGRIWQVDLQRQDFTPVELHESLIQAGTPLVITQLAGDQLFVVDRSGNLLEYTLRVAGWSRPLLVSDGFVSGGVVAATTFDTPRGAAVVLATVDTRGRIRVLTGEHDVWTDDIVPDVRLSGGTPIAVAQFGERIVLSAVSADGQWFALVRGGTGNLWTASPIADGFPSGAAIQLDPAGASAFAVDRTGRVVAARLVGGRWECNVCAPAFDFGPRLVRRAIVPNPPLESVTVELLNQHTEDLVVRLVDVRAPDRPIEVKIPAGGSARKSIERDSGASLEEVYLVPGRRGELVEEVHRHPLTPRSLYNVVVFADRVTSVYFDRTRNKGPEPDEVQKSLVSLGAFSLPAGDRLQNGDRIDVYAEAAGRNNPGAAAIIDLPRP